MIGFIGKIRRRMPLGWLQLSRHKGRFLVAISGVAFADLLMFMQLGFQSALFNSATRLHKSLQGDIVIFSTQARNLTDMSTFTRRRLYQAMNVPGVKSVDAIYTNTIKWKNPLTRNRNNLLIVGFDPDQQVFNIPEINTQLQKTKLPDTLLLDTKTRGEYTEVISQIQQGKTVTTEVERRTVTISGLFTVGSSFGSDGHLMTSDQNFLRLFPRREAASISLGLINLKPGHDLEVVTNALKNHLPQDDINILTKEEFIAFEKGYWQKASPIGFVFGLGTAMGFTVGVIIVYQVLSTDVNAHIKEYATFKAMGYRNIYLLGIVFEEAFILVISGFIPGAGISIGLYALTRQATNLPLFMTGLRAIQVLILTFIMCMISGIIATHKVQSADPADMF
ncbi:MAG: ABC transporter permease DevC [Mastigocoleus sp. MO_167.B18]|uniref:ABC transporter permease DevC n=1 Tax=Mastigocoleus sp. MO_188.B34 TaxID=3036635 RepID=UPI00261A00B6|nr:ABC transporter permease DevC [Mastigocoleus sp. MO_188.B34]MDJ0693505.1 ABC transporter permease DevC [Mastigocoleus sp. MO_188.B34]MDJ0772528.1 ABC transporter permease DevC [Mastigocoleus sp. MO_167.B18]